MHHTAARRLGSGQLSVRAVSSGVPINCSAEDNDGFAGRAVANSLLKQAQELPPGADRNDALKDIGKLRQRLEALKNQHRRDRTP